MQDLLLTPFVGTAARLQPHLYETMFLTTLAGETRKVLIPRAAAQALATLLDLARGKRIVATSGQDLASLGNAAKRTTHRGIDYLEEIGFIARTERGTTLRRIRLEAALDSFEMKKLPPRAQHLLRTLYEMGAGQRTFTLSAAQLFERSGMQPIHCAKDLILLRSRKAITELMPATGKLDIYRIDVRRRQGRGLQVLQLSPEIEEEEALIIVADAKRGELTA